MRRCCVLVLLTWATGLWAQTPDWHFSTQGWARLSLVQFRETVFNPDFLATDKLSMPDRSAAWAQRLGLSGQWKSWSVRGAWRGEAKRDTAWHGQGQLQEAELSLDRGGWVVTAGRSLLRWGTGYAFNPTDFMAPAKSVSDPENRDGTAVGRDLVKVERFGETLSLALGAVLPSQGRWEERWSRPQFVGRFYGAVGDVDLSLLVRTDKRGHSQWGMNLATVVGERLELHGEVRWATEASQRAALAGFQITLPGDILCIGEVWHDGAGLDESSWNRAVQSAQEAGELWRACPNAQTEGLVLSQLSVWQGEGGLMRRYGFVHLSGTGPWALSLRLSVLTNLYDFSRVVMPEVQREWGKHLSLYVRGAIFGGAADSEYGALVYAHSLEGGLRFHG